MEQFIAAAQDRTRNALQTSLLAGFNAWKEQLRADEVAFESDKILYPDWFENIAWSGNIYRSFEVAACLLSAFCFFHLQIKVWARGCKEANTSGPSVGGHLITSEWESLNFISFEDLLKTCKGWKHHVALIQIVGRSATPKHGMWWQTTWIRTWECSPVSRPLLTAQWCLPSTPGFQNRWMTWLKWNLPMITRSLDGFACQRPEWSGPRNGTSSLPLCATSYISTPRMASFWSSTPTGHLKWKAAPRKNLRGASCSPLAFEQFTYRKKKIYWILLSEITRNL